MKTTLITRHNSPALVAKDIRRAINEELKEQRPTYFVGRQSESQEALEILTSYPDPQYRPPMFVFGLSGIGRRSLVRDFGRNNLSYSKTIEVNLREGDLLPELLLKLSTALAHSNIGNPNEFLKHHSTRDHHLLIIDIIESLVGICATSTLPIIVDQGAIAAENRTLRSDFDSLYSAVTTEQRADCVLITNHRIHPAAGTALPSVRVSELSQSATQNFVRLLARDRSLRLSASDVEAIGQYSRGYPPAVVFAIGEALTYGVPHVVANQQALVNFSANIFLRQLSTDEKITKPMAEILQLLANYSPLPLSIIQAFVGIAENEKLAELISYLIDFAFILPEGINYRISEPIRDAAYRTFGGYRLDHKLISDLLEMHLKKSEDDEDRLVLAQNLFRATLIAGQKESTYAVGLASDLVQLTTQAYHDQEYDNALKFGSRAVEIRPDSANVRRYVAQALIRKEEYGKAEIHIKALIEQGHLGEAFYVRGFMARRKHEYEPAIENYLKSIEYGRGGPAIHRELASCYFERGNIPKAEAHINIAQKASPHNRFVVDLQCIIALRTGNMAAAKKALAVLERVDPSGFYQHRMSTFEQAQGHQAEALEYAKKAVDSVTRPQFEILANLANCQIEAGQLPEAGSTLSDLQKRFSGTHHDAMVGLRCKLEIKRGEIDIAEALWSRIREKGTGVHSGLRLALLNRKAQLKSLSGPELKEQAELLDRLKNVDWLRNERLLGSVVSIEE
jgi:tetratricopeptide (TPR) repeat protein